MTMLFIDLPPYVGCVDSLKGLKNRSIKNFLPSQRNQWGFGVIRSMKLTFAGLLLVVAYVVIDLFGKIWNFILGLISRKAQTHFCYK